MAMTHLSLFTGCLCRKECLIVHVQENYSAKEIAQMIGARELEVEFA